MHYTFPRLLKQLFHEVIQLTCCQQSWHISGAIVGSSFGDNGSLCKAMWSHVAVARPPMWCGWFRCCACVVPPLCANTLVHFYMG